MGNFETTIPKNIALLEKEIGAKRREKWSIEAEYEHDCNCEYCTVDESDDPSKEDQAAIEKLEDEINDILLTINRLKRHAQVHGVKI